jgi:phosphonate transport system substrate-binding protein
VTLSSEEEEVGVMVTPMLPRWTAALGGALVLGLLSIWSADGASAAQSREIRVAVTDLQGLEELQREFGAFEETFEETSGISIDFYPVNDRVAAAVALETDRVDVVFTGPAEYVVIRERTGAKPITAIRRPDYHSCIYTKADAGISDVDDLEGKTIGMSDIGSTSGHLGPSQILVDAGLDPQDDVEVITVGDAVHEALKRGDVDAVGIGCHDYDEFMESDDADDYTVLVEGDALPPDILLARKGLDKATIKKIRATFRKDFDELLEAMLEGKDNAKYENAELVEITDSDYDVVRSMYRAIGVDDFSEFVGD